MANDGFVWMDDDRPGPTRTSSPRVRDTGSEPDTLVAVVERQAPSDPEPTLAAIGAQLGRWVSVRVAHAKRTVPRWLARRVAERLLPSF
jgi:hypothetical protein